MQNIKLPLDMVLESLLCGVLLSTAYFSLLWYSLKILPNINKKGLFLLISTLFRLGIFLAVSILIAMDHPVKLIWMFLAFLITRLFIVNYFSTKGKVCLKI